MSDILLFFIGCFVSLIVASAVALLLWAAANEPRGGRSKVAESARRPVSAARPMPLTVRVERTSRVAKRWNRSI